MSAEGTRRHIRGALEAGATREEILMTLKVASLLALHTCSLGAPILLEEAKAVQGVAGKIGTAVAQSHLRSTMAFCNAPLMNSIEAYIQFESGLISDKGEVTNPSTAKFLEGFMNEFHGFITRVCTVLQRNA